jgi:hypothetical protein
MDNRTYTEDLKDPANGFWLRASARASPGARRDRWIHLAEWLEGVLEVVARDLVAEKHTGDT